MKKQYIKYEEALEVIESIENDADGLLRNTEGFDETIELAKGLLSEAMGGEFENAGTITYEDALDIIEFIRDGAEDILRESENFDVALDAVTALIKEKLEFENEEF